VHLLSGFSTLKLSAGTTFKDQDGGIGLEVRPQINIEWGSLNAALDMFYQGRLGSNFGAFPLSRAGTGIYYYPAGLPLQTTVLDNGVTVNQNRFAPFVMGQLTLTTVAVTALNSVSSGPLSFNGLTVGFQVGGGGELPLSQGWSLVAEIIIEGTVAGGVTGNNNSALSYSLVNGMLGVSIHP
jgi:hypothetical protein